MTLTGKQKKILNSLIDKYERSASFRGGNKKMQRFSIKPESLFPKYLDEREYDLFVELNQDIRDLERIDYITVSEINMRISIVTLNTEKLPDIYPLLGREPKKKALSDVAIFLEEQKIYLDDQGLNSDIAGVLSEYMDSQKRRLSACKFPEYYDESVKDPLSDYGDFWTVLRFILNNEDDMYIRDISVRLFNDSKRFEQLRGRISGCLYKYGDFPEKDTVLEECGIIQTPSYVAVRGPVLIGLGEQQIDVGKLTGDIAFSTEALKGISEIKVYGKRIITVENLTSFHSMSASYEDVTVYLGGYHNRTKREFLKILYTGNKDKEYYHFGDIDAGGFYIYEHLKDKTGIPFAPMNMDVSALRSYMNYTRELTSNDIARLNKLLSDCQKKTAGSELDPVEMNIYKSITETIQYMLDHNVKLEQEAIDGMI